MIMKTIFFFLTLISAVSVGRAQTPTPAKPQEKAIALIGGVAHLGNGQVIANSIVAFDKGKLTIVADATTARADLSGYEQINVQGKHIYPGFILPNSQIGLAEVSSIRAMNDATERGDLNPNVRALISYNTDSEYGPTFRYNGVLLAETTPTGGLISGSSSLMEMDGWNWEDAVHTADNALHLNWPPQIRRQFDFNTFTVNDAPNRDYDKQVMALHQLMADAQAYAQQAQREANLKLEAVQPLFSGQRVLMVHADEPKEIVEAVRFGQKFGVKKITVVGGYGAPGVAQFLKETNIPVILASTHNLPNRADEDIDTPYKLPYLLQQAGVQVSLSQDGALHGARNLGFFAGTAVAYGVDKEEALKMITSNTAKALGVEARVGTLEVGKDATLFVSEGDALDYRTNRLTHAFIRGKAITLRNHQNELYERYAKKYGQMK